MYLSDKIGMELDGIITGVENFGMFITGVEIPAEGFVHISALTDDYYRYDRAGHVIAGFRSGNSYRLGDSVRVAVANVDIDTRELDFRLVGRAAGAKRPSIKRPTKTRGKRTAKAAARPKIKPRPAKTERRQRRGG
jgi:ribonuclease R